MQKKEKVKSESIKKVLTGKVVRYNDNEKTVKVIVERKFSHPKYGKIIKSHKKYLVHNGTDKNLEIGNEVMIEESKPISKLKTWIIKEIVK